jgi:hypothetical protein
MKVQIITSFLFLCFSCNETNPIIKQDKSINENHFPFVSKVINLGDTARIEIETYGNKVIKHYIDLKNKLDDGSINSYDIVSTYSEKMNDTTINSKFYITLNEYNIYFDKSIVIQYCDSVLSSQNSESKRLHFQNLKRFVRNQKIINNKPFSEIPSMKSELLDLFTGKIVNSTTRIKPKSLLIESYFSELSGSGGKKYYVISKKGDTTLVETTIEYYL